MGTRIRIKRGTESQITGYTGPHYEGELAFATNTGSVFVNDGTQFISVGGSSETPTLQSVTDAGNTTTNDIGIGTASPSYPLHVEGNSLVTGTQFIGDTFSRIQQGSGNLILQNSFSTGGIVLRTDSTERVRITDTGRMGIGTTSPISKLELQDGTLTVDNGNIDVFFGGISISRNSANNTALKVNQRGTADIFALQDDGTDVLTVIDGGNVGIGTTTPSDYYSNKLVVSAPDENGITIAAGTANAGNHIMFADGTSGSEAYRGYLSYNHFEDSMRIGAGGSERMRITLNGDVGIGTTSPAEKLEVDGNIISTWNNNRFIGIQFEDGDDFKNGLVLKAGDRSTGLIAKASNNNPYIWFGTGSEPVSERMRITDTGNVGIGTTAPSEKLEVAGNIKTTSGNLFNYNANTIGEIRGNANTYNNFDLVYGASWDGSNWIDTLGAYQSHKLTIGTGGMMFLTGSGQAGGFPVAYTERFRISNTGNVGIGTTSPSAPLHLIGDFKIGTSFTISTSGTDATISTGRWLILNPGDAIKILSDIALDVNHVSWHLGNRNLTIKSAGNGQFKIETLQNTIINPVSGNVGIGTTAPAAKLHVAGEVRINAGQPLMLDVSNNIYAVAAQNQFRLYSGGNPALNITTTGNVGIGTTSPDSKLEVEGTAMRQFRIKQAGGPSSSTDVSGREGDFAYDDNYVYVKTINGWGRVALDFGF